MIKKIIGFLETLYLSLIPGLKKSLLKAKNETDFIDSEKIHWE